MSTLAEHSAEDLSVAAGFADHDGPAVLRHPL
jgi:hypothetical protein